MRVQHLESLQMISSSNKPDFGFCDDITSGLMEGYCAAYASEIADERRNEKAQALAARGGTAWRPSALP